MINIKKFLWELKTSIFDRNLISYLKKNYITRITGICVISIFLLVLISPVFSLLWLCIPTLYFLYMHNYKNIFKIWGFTIGIWYLIFTTSLYEVTILIGFENTTLIINYLLDNHFLFENLCFQTVYILDDLSAKLGVSIYIPAIINIRYVSKLFRNNPTGCSGKEDSDEKEKEKNNSYWWWRSNPKKSQSEADMSQCETLAKQLEETRRWFRFNMHSSNSTSDGERTVTYNRTWVPFYGVYNSCYSRPANEAEKQAYGKDKKKT